MNLTDQEIKELVTEVTQDITGTTVNPNPHALLRLNDKSLTDNIRYPNDPRKQFVLESIVLGASMKDAFDHLSKEEARLRGKVLIQFLAQLGIHITYQYDPKL